MRAGDLDRRVTIQSRGDVDDGFGQPQPTWPELDVVWAKVRRRFGREFLEGGVQAEADIVFTIRHRTDVTHAMRIVYDGDNYDIVSIIEIGRKEGLEIAAKAQVD